MRCDLMRGSNIANVELLKEGSDSELLQLALAVSEVHAARACDGFEVWVEKRLIYRCTAAMKTGEKPQLAT